MHVCMCEGYGASGSHRQQLADIRSIQCRQGDGQS